LQCEKPFTELYKRLDENDNPLLGFEPYKQIDKIAMHHDINYRKADEGIVTRHEEDKIMLDELKALITKGIREKIDWIKDQNSLNATLRSSSSKKYRVISCLQRTQSICD